MNISIRDNYFGRAVLAMMIDETMTMPMSIEMGMVMVIGDVFAMVMVMVVAMVNGET